MEFYLSADSAEDFIELSLASLVHLYFVKVQPKPIGYDHMNAEEKQEAISSNMKKFRKFGKKKVIEALMEAVRAHYNFIWALGATANAL